MKILVVSFPDKIENEAAIVNGLFEEGLALFHLRKPAFSEKQLLEFIDNIDPRYRSKVVLHQHHDLAKDAGICRLHLPEKERLKGNEAAWHGFTAKGFVLSTSIHELEESDKLSEAFRYSFFGPVFESISKPGYFPKKGKTSLEKKKRTTEIIAIGGITQDKIAEIEQRNFDGAALLGAIWKDAKNAVKTFNECRQKLNMQ